MYARWLAILCYSPPPRSTNVSSAPSKIKFRTISAQSRSSTSYPEGAKHMLNTDAASASVWCTFRMFRRLEQPQKIVDVICQFLPTAGQPPHPEDLPKDPRLSRRRRRRNDTPQVTSNELGSSPYTLTRP